MRAPAPVIVIGAGPVGLCLALALAKEGIASTLVEELGPGNFLEQVPRAGTNHPATLELYDRIGLYERLEPRGIVAPVFHYWDRREGLIAEFDHAVLKDDTRFPFVLQCERIKVVEEALALARAEPLVDLRLETRFVRLLAERRWRRGRMRRPRRRRAAPRRLVPRQRRRRAQHRAQGARHRVRGLHLSRPHAQHRSRLRFHAARLCAPQLHLRSRRVVEPVPLERPAGALARAFSDLARGRSRRAPRARGCCNSG